MFDRKNEGGTATLDRPRDRPRSDQPRTRRVEGSSPPVQEPSPSQGVTADSPTANLSEANSPMADRPFSLQFFLGAFATVVRMGPGLYVFGFGSQKLNTESTDEPTAVESASTLSNDSEVEMNCPWTGGRCASHCALSRMRAPQRI